jgi:hypothetical protein
MAAYRLMWPVDLPPNVEKDYRDYVKANFSFLIQGNEENIEVIDEFEKAGLVTHYRLKQLLDNATQKGKAELAAFLMEKINSVYGSKVKSLAL